MTWPEAAVAITACIGLSVMFTAAIVVAPFCNLIYKVWKEMNEN